MNYIVGGSIGFVFKFVAVRTGRSFSRSSGCAPLDCRRWAAARLAWTAPAAACLGGHAGLAARALVATLAFSFPDLLAEHLIFASCRGFFTHGFRSSFGFALYKGSFQ